MRSFLRKGAAALVMAAVPFMAAPAVSGDAESAAALALLSAGVSGKEGQPLSLKEVLKINAAVQFLGLPKKVSKELIINSLYVTPGSEMYVEGQIADPKYDESVRAKLAAMDRKARIAAMCRYPLVKSYLSRLKLVCQSPTMTAVMRALPRRRRRKRAADGSIPGSGRSNHR